MPKWLIIWLYWIPTWELALLFFVLISGGSLLGLLISRRLMRRYPHQANDLVFNFVASASVVYALVLGLIAVATWERFEQVETVANEEAFALSNLYADAGGLDDHTRLAVQNEIRNYLRFVINKEWPAQRRGSAISGGDALVGQMESDLVHAADATDDERAVHAQAFVEFNNFIFRRRARREAVNYSLPGILYLVVFAGAALLIMMTYGLWTEKFVLQFLLTLGLAAMLSLVVVLVVAMDHPLWGPVSVSPHTYKTVLSALSNPEP